MSGKSIIVYYSWVGNTQSVANCIQKQTGFSQRRIEEKTERKKGKIMMPAMGAFFGLKSGIKPMDFKFEGYENVFLGAQVWAGKTTPAINTFLSKAKFDGKKVWLFITKADDKLPQNVIDSITDRIEKKGGRIMDSVSFTTKIDTVISEEDIKDTITDWLKRNGF